jgi:hypothetical protein
MVKPLTMPSDAEHLKRRLHEQIEQLDASKLSLLNRVVLQLEAQELAAELDAAFDQDRQTGKLTEERIKQVLADVRAAHPCG